MHPTLTALRQTPQPTPTQFLALHPGCFIQYYDDTPAKDAAKALSTRSFEPATAQRKQQQHCAVCFSLQAFAGSRTKEGLVNYRHLGVDIDLIPEPERRTISAEEADGRKDDYLSRCLLPFPLKPHWLIETGHGFHAIFRILPLRKATDIRDAEAVNRRLVRCLRGDANATHLTQVLRVPGTYQFKDPSQPFLCRLLLDDAGAIAPYDLPLVRGILDACDADHGTEASPHPSEGTQEHDTAHRLARWGAGFAGAPEGSRNVTAASVIGKILCRLPVSLWETAGWGGLKEWNRKNVVPLPQRELRSVFENIAGREYAKRQLQRREAQTGAPEDIVVGPDTAPHTPC